MYRPVILLGNGMRGQPDVVSKLIESKIPILTTWMAADLIPEYHPAFCGRPGIFGQRAANIIQQSATHLYCYGARLDGEQVAYDYDRFAPNAQIYVYDIDEAERSKFSARFNVTNVLHFPLPAADWLVECRALYNKWRPELDGKDGGKFVDPFAFLSALHDVSRDDDVFAIGSSGNAPTTFYQSYKVKQGQRITNVCTIGAMGADIPMAIGAAMATGRRVICVTGDGGFQLNVQELEVVSREHLNITFFVMNNDGYNSIRTAQLARMGRKYGADRESGLTLPRLEEIALAYRLMYYKLDNASNIEKCFTAAPMLVEVMVDPAWVQLPRVMASVVDGVLKTDDMEDMTPK